MCKETTNQLQPLPTVTRNVIISGAGPSGLLLTALLLNHNRQAAQQQQQELDGSTPSHIRYNVTMVELRKDLGDLDIKRDLPQYRSWMIGLAGHGLNALRTLPKLYKDYVNTPYVGVKLETFGLYMGKTKIENQIEDDVKQSLGEAFIVDRNFVVAAMARYLNDEHGNDPYFKKSYETKIQYVDAANQRVLVRHVNEDNSRESKSTKDEYYLDYDLLVGADGSRSTVRQALLESVYDFEMDFGDIFQQFRAVHVQKPETLNGNGMSLLPGCLPNGMNGICLPMPKSAVNDDEPQMVNISIGIPRNRTPAPELESDDVAVVADYFKKHFKCFELVDYDEFARQWIQPGRWNRTAQVHCNQYHSTTAKICIMGDAAHATSPSIGMGMNTALRDAASIYKIMVEQEQSQAKVIDYGKDASWDDNQNLDNVLKEFSKQRVKEGQSLTDLAFHLYCLDETAQVLETVHMIVRNQLYFWFPWFFHPHPQIIIGNPMYDLSQVYDLASQTLGIIPKHRAINGKIRRKFLEESLGMASQPEKKTSGMMLLLGLSTFFVAGMAVFVKFFELSG